MNKYTNWIITLIWSFLVGCGNGKINTQILDKEEVINPIKNHVFFGLDSIEIIKKAQIDSKKYFYSDTIQGIDTLVTEYSYSEDENRFLFQRAIMINAKDRDYFFNLSRDNMNLKKTNQLFVIIQDTIPNETKKQVWRITKNKLKWELVNNTKTIYKDQRTKQIYNYSQNGDYQLTEYIYKDTLLSGLIYYKVSGLDTSIIRKEILEYDKNNNLVEHIKLGFLNELKKMYTSSKEIYKYDNSGNKVNFKYLTYNSEMPDSLKLEEESSYRYNNKNVLEYSKTISVFSGADFITNYIYNDLGNCTSHELNRFDHGYKFVKKEFIYDTLQRVVKYNLLQKNAENATYDTTEIQKFEYYNATSFLKKHQKGKSSNFLESKWNVEFDKHGNITKLNGEKGYRFTEFIFNYDIPIKAVVADNNDFYQNMLSPEITDYGLKVNRIKNKISHAISTKITRVLENDKYVNHNEIRYHYSKK